MSDFTSSRNQKCVVSENRRRKEWKHYRARYRSAIVGFLFYSSVLAGYVYLAVAPTKVMALFHQSPSPSLVSVVTYASGFGITLLLMGIAMQACSVIRSRRAFRHHQKKRCEKPLVDAREQDDEELVER